MRRHRSPRLSALLRTANNLIEAQDDTLVVLRDELHRLQDENRHLNNELARLERILDNVRADNQTQAAILRGEYRFKTGEPTNG